MKNRLSGTLFAIYLVAGSLAMMSPSIDAAGFRQLQVNDSGHPELTVGLWYPSDQLAPDKPNTEFGLPVSLNAPVTDSNGALILISHGFGGWYGGHADTAAALADAGFIVAAPSHAGNTWSDMSSSIDQWALDRPRHLSRVIDHVLADKEFQQQIDPEKIGVYGFSAGGYTALTLLGGVPDLDHAAQHCAEHPREFACSEGMIDAMRKAGMWNLPDRTWGAEPRIKAASMAAPGLGFAFTRESLANVSVPVQLWSGGRDERVPTKTNAAWLAGQLPQVPETHWIDRANHFAFMVVACREAFKRADPKEYEVICADADGFDRQAFHDDMHAEMIRFFTASLGLLEPN